MRTTWMAAWGAAAALAFTFTVATDADARRRAVSCAQATAEGSGITEAIARTNAANALSNVAARTGGTRTGAVRTTCTKGFGGIFTSCQSSQRVCTSAKRAKS